MEGEWLNGVPHGLCIVDSKNYRGVITFVHGKEIGPRWIESKGYGIRFSYEYYTGNGDAKGLYRDYTSDKSTSHVNTTTHQIPTPGWIKRIIKDLSQRV